MNIDINAIKQFKSFMKNGITPQGLANSMLNTNNSNPMINNLINMAKNGDNKGIENFARNICKEKNIDFDKDFQEFIKQLNG